MLKNSEVAWGWLARNLHWLMAVLILGQMGLGKYAHELDLSPEKLNLMMWHKSIGITLLFLAIARLTWALLNPRPAPPEGIARWQQRAAGLSHTALYGLMLAIPISGWLFNSAKNVPFSLYRVVPWPSLIGADDELAEVFGEWHEGLVLTLLILLGVHVSAALWHHFVRRDEVLLRMLTGRPTR
jgi:cytochrome b561